MNTTAFTWPAVIGQLIRGQSLTSEAAAWAMNEIMDGAATSAQIAGFGVALRAKGETADEVTGLASAMLDHATPLSIPGPLTDLVGTGGDRARTVNISTMGAIVAAAAGARMAKHGNRAASSACGAAELAGVLAARGASALVFHGDDGLDELTTTGPSTVWVARDGSVGETKFDPAEIGVDRSQPADLVGGDPDHNAAVARAVLDGQRGPVRETVLLNAAAALAAHAGVPEPSELPAALARGLALAAEAVDSGAAAALLDRWIRASRRLAG